MKPVSPSLAGIEPEPVPDAPPAAAPLPPEPYRRTSKYLSYCWPSLEQVECPHCNGAGYVLEGPPPGTGRACDCGEVYKRAARETLPRAWRNRGFCDYRGDAFPAAVKTEMRRLVRSIQDWSIAPRGFLTIAGAVGTGKTHLAMAAAREHLMQQARTVDGGSLEVAVWSTLWADIRATFSRSSDRSEADVIRPLRNAGLLILDDVGTVGSDHANGILFDLLNGRMDAEVGTLLTTNLTPSELEVQLGGIGSRIVSRLQSGLWVQLPATLADYRTTKGKTNAQ